MTTRWVGVVHFETGYMVVSIIQDVAWCMHPALQTMSNATWTAWHKSLLSSKLCITAMAVCKLDGAADVMH